MEARDAVLLWVLQGLAAPLYGALAVVGLIVPGVVGWHPELVALEVRFYERHGFRLAPRACSAALLRTCWTVPARQVESFVVLASPALSVDDAARLMAAA